MKNHNLIEEYPREYESTQFEKVLLAAKRAKDLHNADKAPMVLSDRKAGYVALEEILEKKIFLLYKEEEAVTEMISDDNESEE